MAKIAKAIHVSALGRTFIVQRRYQILKTHDFSVQNILHIHWIKRGDCKTSRKKT